MIATVFPLIYLCDSERNVQERGQTVEVLVCEGES